MTCGISVSPCCKVTVSLSLSLSPSLSLSLSLYFQFLNVSYLLLFQSWGVHHAAQDLVWGTYPPTSVWSVPTTNSHDFTCYDKAHGPHADRGRQFGHEANTAAASDQLSTTISSQHTALQLSHDFSQAG